MRAREKEADNNRRVYGAVSSDVKVEIDDDVEHANESHLNTDT